MTPILVAAVAVAAGYFVGAIPFAYAVVLWRKGIDIRTVGSGNVGATNVGRLLGFRYFLLVLALDVAKGFLPTWVLPPVLGPTFPSLPVLVGLATILGHNFPIYLRFRGGKGVATSLGALLALDPIACAGAFVAFVVMLLMTRFVSLSSIAGALGFTAVHFARVSEPWSHDEFLMSATTLLLLVLLIFRHRKNLVRIGSGTEPRVRFRLRGPNHPEAPG